MVTALAKTTTTQKPVSASPSAPPYARRKFTREEYYRLGELDFLDGERVELIDGEIICMSPVGTFHSTAVELGDDVLRRVFREGYGIRIQQPLSIKDQSDPQPDIAIVRGKARDYKDAHPTTAVLIVEVSESSLEYDRTTKASLYALADVPDYWILNLIERRLEVLRGPTAMEEQPFGFGYRNLSLYLADEEVAPLERPNRKIKVSDLLP